VLFSADAREGLATGAITCTFRTWSRPQARAGGRYRVLGLTVEVDAVERVEVSAITDDDARCAGEPDAAAVRRRLGDPPLGTLVWRIELHVIGPDEREVLREQAQLDDDEVAAIRARLARLDRAAPAGPWTVATLRLVERYPGIVSTTLARHAGRERLAFKADVRKLKELGLTESLDVGYRLSPRGAEVLRRL